MIQSRSSFYHPHMLSTYRGRFAPSPTGPLHFGSLVAAVGSYLESKSKSGNWLVRMEDLDTPRCIPGAADDILHTLDIFGLRSDEPVMYQSQRTPAYAAALRQLQNSGVAYPCCCTRREISDSALHGIEGPVYPGTCRTGIPTEREARSWRVRTDGQVTEFVDALQGVISQQLETEIGDFVVKRADGLFAYQLAVVVDDAAQDITHIVRGADLLNSTPRQIHLQRLLGLTAPAYMHLPVAVNEAGEKLSKQTLASPVDVSQPVTTLIRVLDFLRQEPPKTLANGNVGTVLDWAIKNWDATKLQGVKSIHA
ncbi:MAG: glutamyl-Q tRNA(Asp) synthetase [Gallionellaceae bacterium]|nr:MAG: glutamyl-Q tRNA(Asp) synthetase [Gallionellaceae bacterium]